MKIVSHVLDKIWDGRKKEMSIARFHAVCGVWDMRYGTISKFWDIVVRPFVSMSVCVYKVGRYQDFHGVPYQEYCVYY